MPWKRSGPGARLLNLVSWLTVSRQETSPLSRRPESGLTGESRWDGSMTGIKLLLRSYNRLRLYLKFYWFYEQIEARHATMSLHIHVESVSPPFYFYFKVQD